MATYFFASVATSAVPYSKLMSELNVKSRPLLWKMSIQVIRELPNKTSKFIDTVTPLNILFIC